MVGDEVCHVVILDPLRIIFPGNAEVNSLPLAIGIRCNYEIESFYPFFSTTSMSKSQYVLCVDLWLRAQFSLNSVNVVLRVSMYWYIIKENQWRHHRMQTMKLLSWRLFFHGLNTTYRICYGSSLIKTKWLLHVWFWKVSETTYLLLLAFENLCIDTEFCKGL